MAKYDSQLGDLKNQIAASKSVLIALPSSVGNDKLAAALTLYLSLKQLGKEVSIATEDTIKVSHSNLFGIGQITSNLPKTGGGNMVITLEGVVASDGQVPGLEKVDWHPDGENLNLVFYTLPGAKFQPSRIVPSYQSGEGFDLVFVIGAPNLDALGNIYKNNTGVFSGNLINIDNEPANTLFGKVNVVDQGWSVSEIVAQIIPSLELPFDADMASNILAGIYDATVNLTTKTRPDTFLAVGFAMQSGGKNPLTPQEQMVIHHSSPEQPASTTSTDVMVQQYNQNFPPLNQVFGIPSSPVPAPAATSTPIPVAQPLSDPTQGGSVIPLVANQAAQAVTEEKPEGEGLAPGADVENPAPDWLTPKIYGGRGNIG